MDAPRFDWWTRTLTDTASRRSVLGLSGVALGLAATRFSGIATAKKKHKKKNPQKLTRNSFGCVDVGKACRGKDANCCSGICQGKKPKRGKRDKSRCVAHHVDICQPGQKSLRCGGSDETFVFCTLPNGETGLCERTTGNASYCAGSHVVCESCAKDADCLALCGPGAACITCSGCAGGTTCVGLDLESCIE
jgi:hypothetical protein